MCNCRGRSSSPPELSSGGRAAAPKATSCWEVTYPDGTKAEGKFMDPVEARKHARRRGIGSTATKVPC